MKRSIVLFLLMLIVVLPVLAQDESPTPDVATLESTVTEVPTETATPEPTVVVEPTTAPVEEGPIIADEVNFRVGIFGILTILGMAILGGGGIGYVWGYVRANVDAKDRIEQAINATSPATQEHIDNLLDQLSNAWNTADKFARELLALGREVTDDLPNMEGPNDFRGDVTRR